MKKRFTRILAALALLVGLTIPLGMWGQTWTRVTSADDLLAGGTFILGYEATANSGVIVPMQNEGTATLSAAGYMHSGTTQGSSTNGTIDMSNVTSTSLYEVTIVASTSVSGAICIKIGDSFLGNTNTKNNCKLFASESNTTAFTPIVKTNNTFELKIAANQTYFDLQYNSGSPRFAVYGGAQKHPVIYKKETGGTPTCATPTFSPAAGTYTQAQNVSISCATEGAIIYYTTNGDEPTTNSTVYTAAINVSTNTTIKAIAAKSGYDNSTVASADYNFVTIEHAGTEADPYTVADARTAIDANVGTQDVYVSGIVTRRYNNTVSNGQLSYYISDDGTQNNELEAYKGLYLNGAEFTSYDQIQAGDVVVIYGNLTKFNNTYELAEGNYLVSHTQGTTPSISADNVTLAYDATSGEIDYTITNPASGVTLTASTTASWISDLTVDATNSKVTFTTTANEGTEDRTATVTLSYNGATDKDVTVTQRHYVSDVASLPFSFDGGKNDIANTAGLSEDGLGSDYNNSPKLKFDHAGDYLILKFNERPGTLSFDIKGNSFSQSTFKVQTSVDGTNYTDLAIYTTDDMPTTVQTEEFNNLGENVRYIKWIYTNKSSGNVALGAITLAQYVAPTGPTVNIGTLTHVTSLQMWYFDSDVVDINDGDEVESGIEVFVQPTAETGYSIESVTVLDANGGQVSVTENSGNWSFYMPNSSVTINATATESSVTPVTGDKYVKVTSTTDLTSGQYLIVYEDGPVAFDGSLETLDAVGNTIEVILNNNVIAVSDATAAAEFTIDVTAGTIKSASGYYIGQTSDANGLASSTTTAYTNTISFDESGNANIVSSGGAYLRYNSDSNAKRFRYYKSSTYTGQKAIQLYKKVESLQKTLIADRWYIIASPFVGSVTTNAMEASNLYFYDEQDHYWRSKTLHENDFNFASGTGYLCGNKNVNFELTFEGTVSEDDIKEIPLKYHATTTANEDNPLAGWNLVGNPFATTAAISNDYYIMNEDGDGLIVGESNVVDAMQGVFVQATPEDQTVIFQKAEVGVGGGDDKLVVNLSQNRSNIIDRAIIRFGEGRQLPKFQLFEDNTKLYIPQDGQDYAVVRSEGQGELPVNFRASENGTYTLSMDVENMGMNYLHLIDNMTGMDVDLLQTPSYTFEAKVNDYESRFRLVFAANNEDGASTSSTAFAFYSNGSWIINNAGEATLQVVDLTGRILSSETVNGSVSKTINAVPGVYMLRLINGDNVNVQKIVVR